MKRIISKFMVVVMVILGISYLTACGKHNPCSVTLPEKMPTGVKEITCNSTYTEGDVIKTGTAYDGQYEITVVFENGYELGELKILADRKDITEHRYYSETILSDSAISYKFVGVRKNVTITTEGSAKKIDYTITFGIEKATIQNVVFNSAKFMYTTNIDGTKTESNIYSGVELKNAIPEKITKTMHYGDTFELTIWNENPYSYVYNPIFGDAEETIYNIKEGIIKTRKIITVTGNTDLVLREDSIGESDSMTSLTLMDFSSTELELVDSTGSALDADGISLSELHDYTSQIAVAISPTLNTIDAYIWENISDDKLTVKINGKVVDKINITKTNNTYYIQNVLKAYEYVDEHGNMRYRANGYNIEIVGLEAFLASKTEDLRKIDVTVHEKFSNISVEITSPTVLGYALKTGTTEFKIIITGEVTTFNLLYKDILNNTVAYNAFETLNNGTTAEGDEVEKTIGTDFVEWSISSANNIVLITIN